MNIGRFAQFAASLNQLLASNHDRLLEQATSRRGVMGSCMRRDVVQVQLDLNHN